jgi:hypothetical protein
MVSEMRCFVLQVVVAVVCCNAWPCRGDLIFDVRHNDVSGTAFHVGLGQQITLAFYLKENGPDESRLSTYGLFGSNIGLVYGDEVTNASVVGATSVGDALKIAEKTSYGYEVGSAYFLATPPKGSELLLATVTFQAGAAGNTTTFQIVEPFPQEEGIVLNDSQFTGLDREVFAGIPTTFTIATAVPEPGQLLALSIASVVGTMVGRCRRR